MVPVYSAQDEQGMQVDENPLLFINRYSKEPIGRHHGPDRTAVSVHVQRTIRKKKQHNAMMRLKSREFSKGLLKYRIVKMDAERVVASPQIPPKSCVRTSPPSSSGYFFVKRKTASEHERRDARSIVRTNTSTFPWQRNKWRRSYPDTAHGPLERARATVVGGKTHLPSTDQEQDDEQGGYASDGNGEHVPLQRGSKVQKLGQAKFPTVRIASIQDPLGQVGISEVDPFIVYPSELPRQVIDRVLSKGSYAQVLKAREVSLTNVPFPMEVMYLLPQLFPPDEDNLQSLAAGAWYRKLVSARGPFHALLYGQFARDRCINQPKPEQDSPESLFCILEALRAINTKIQGVSNACDDENILTVAALAFSGFSINFDPLRSPRQGPLKALQVLDIYGGTLDTVSAHMEGLAKMLSLRGGLKDIKLLGLAQQISYGGLIVSSRRLIKPPFPFISLNSGLENRLSIMNRPEHPLYNLGQGFVVLKEILSHDNFVALSSVLRLLRDYTLAVDDYVEDRPEAQSLGIIAQERNFVQYRLMSLTIETNMVEVNYECAVYALCRFAATIYSLLAVFPLPPSTAPFAKLSLQIKALLSSPIIQGRWNETPELMVWITVLASIAAIGSNERSWYVSIIDRLFSRFLVSSWRECKQHLQRFLWYSSTNDLDGIDLWKEVQKSSPFSV